MGDEPTEEDEKWYKVTDGYYALRVVAETADDALDRAVAQFRCDETHLSVEEMSEVDSA